MANKINLNNFVEDEENYIDSSDDENEKELLSKIHKKKSKTNSNIESVTVYQFDDDVDDDEFGNEDEDDDDGKNLLINDSDVEDDDAANQDIPNSKAWGSKRKSFYGTSFIDQDYSTYNEKDEQMALEEEESARAIQQRLAQEIEEADFSLDVYSTAKSETEFNLDINNEVKLKADLNELTKREKLQLLKKQSPEFEGLVLDFENNIKECDEILLPSIEYAEKNNINLMAFDFIKFKYKLTLNYLMNITFYFYLKSIKSIVKNHPIIKRILQQRQLLLQLNQKYETSIKTEIIHLLELIKSGEEIKLFEMNINTKNFKSKTTDGGFHDSLVDENEDANERDIRRKITYQIAKNKGLTPHRKKELRNPRVKHRNKFRKALVRRKGAVRVVRTENKRYDGEIFGIKATVKKGIKIKS